MVRFSETKPLGGPYRQEYFPGKPFKAMPWVSKVVVGAGYLFTADIDPRMWDLGTGCLVRTFVGHVGKVMALGVVDDGRRDPCLVTGSVDRTIRSWNVLTGESRIISTCDTKVLCLEFAMLGDRVCVFVGTRQPCPFMVDFDTGEKLMSFTGMTSSGVEGEGHFDAIWDLRIDPEAPFLYSGSKDTTIKKWDISTGFLVATFDGHQDAVRSLSVRGGTLYTTSAENKAISWRRDMPEEKQHFFVKDAWIWCCLAAGGCLFAGTLEGDILQWELAECDDPPLRKHDLPPRAAAAPDPDVRYKGHQNAVRSLCFHEGFLFSGGLDGETKMWDVANRTCVRSFKVETLV